ncbi:MAG TPA: hypothetical protein VKB57_23650 [Acidimicrobiales bacterium]|nr:hypothetical protein [Acidimicrobiales bacterium]
MSDPDSPAPDTGRDFNGRPWSPEQFAHAARNSGYDWVLVQLYRDQGGDYMQACREVGLACGLWDAWPSAERAQLALSFGPDMVCFQAETGQGQACMDAVGAAYQANPAMPLAIVTNLEPSRSDSPAGFDVYMQERNVCVQPEAYASENPDWQDDPPGFANSLWSECVRRGYQSIVIVPSVYWGRCVADYKFTPQACFAPYLAEDMTAAELA